MPLSILIVGAGIGGLAAAVALRQAGHKVKILEKHSQKREVGFAVTLPPNATRVLCHLGIDFAKARMTQWRGIDEIKGDTTPLNWEPGPFLDAEKIWGSPHLVAHRVDLHEALWAKAVEQGAGFPVEILAGVTVIAFDIRGSVTLNNGQVMTADIVVAADGVGSKAHISVVGEERPARNSKLVSLRFTVPTQTLLDNPKTADLLIRGDHRAGSYYNTLNNVGLFRSPCRDNMLQNFGIFYISDNHTDQGLERSVKATKEMALGLLQDFNEAFQEICRLADEKDMYYWRVADRDPLPSFKRDRLVLLGDACHPMQPHLGQGASQASEDAAVLGIVLDSLEDPATISERLDLFQSLRKRKASGIQLLSSSNGMNYILTKDVIEKMRKFISEEELPALTRPAIFNWAHSQDCIAEALTAVAKTKGQDS